MSKGIYQKWLEDDNLILLQGWKRNGLTDEQIASNIGINVRTLSKWKVKYGQIGQALKIGREQANYAVEGKLLKKALSGNTTAMIFWLKNNWRDKYADIHASKLEENLTKAQIEKAKSEIKRTEAQIKLMSGTDDEVEDKVSKLLDKIDDTVKGDDKHDK